MDSGLNATLLQGNYVATNTFGWTEFDIDAATSVMTVTTWGVASLDALALSANPTAILALQPQLVSQFTVSPVPEPSTAVFALSIPTMGLLLFRGRRSILAI